MSDATLDERRMKDLLKEALLEILQERKDLLYDLFSEVLEDFALVKAIQEGEMTDSVSKDEVLKAL